MVLSPVIGLMSLDEIVSLHEAAGGARHHVDLPIVGSTHGSCQAR
jgi:hypothetical protein